jgi:hypothetical protein
MTLSNLAHFGNFELSFIGLANIGNVLAIHFRKGCHKSIRGFVRGIRLSIARRQSQPESEEF